MTSETHQLISLPSPQLLSDTTAAGWLPCVGRMLLTNRNFEGRQHACYTRRKPNELTLWTTMNALHRSTSLQQGLSLGPLPAAVGRARSLTSLPRPQTHLRSSSQHLQAVAGHHVTR